MNCVDIIPIMVIIGLLAMCVPCIGSYYLAG